MSECIRSHVRASVLTSWTHQILRKWSAIKTYDLHPISAILRSKR